MCEPVGEEGGDKIIYRNSSTRFSIFGLILDFFLNQPNSVRAWFTPLLLFECSFEVVDVFKFESCSLRFAKKKLEDSLGRDLRPWEVLVILFGKLLKLLKKICQNNFFQFLNEK